MTLDWSLIVSDEKLTEMYVKQGMGMNRMGEELGCDAKAVRSRLVKIGVTIRPKSGSDKLNKEPSPCI